MPQFLVKVFAILGLNRLNSVCFLVNSSVIFTQLILDLRSLKSGLRTLTVLDFLVIFLGYTRLNLTNLLINLLGLSRLNLAVCFYVRVNTNYTAVCNSNSVALYLKTY